MGCPSRDTAASARETHRLRILGYRNQRTVSVGGTPCSNPEGECFTTRLPARIDAITLRIRLNPAVVAWIPGNLRSGSNSEWFGTNLYDIKPLGKNGLLTIWRSIGPSAPLLVARELSHDLKRLNVLFERSCDLTHGP